MGNKVLKDLQKKKKSNKETFEGGKNNQCEKCYNQIPEIIGYIKRKTQFKVHAF